MSHQQLIPTQLKVLANYGLDIVLFFCGRVPWLYQYWPGGFIFVLFYVQELPKAQPAVDLVLKRLRRWDNSLKSHPTGNYWMV